MKFSYIALLALPCLAAASVLPRGGSDFHEYELCCKHVDYDDYDDVSNGSNGDDPHDHHHHHHDHHYGGDGSGCFPRDVIPWCPFESVDCYSYDRFEGTATGCFHTRDDKKASKANNKVDNNVKAAKKAT